LAFPLPVKNYNDLRADTRTPRILIVVLIPGDSSQWLNQSHDELCLRNCGYWISLDGQQPRRNTRSVTIDIPATNIFSSEQLADLMRKAERGDSL